MAASTLRMVATRSVGARNFWGGWDGCQDVFYRQFDYRDPVRAQLFIDPGQYGVDVRRAAGSARHSQPSVLRRGGLGVGRDQLVRPRLSRLERGARRAD